MVGVEKIEEIVQSVPTNKSAPNIFIWKPSPDGRFTTAAVWEVVRSKHQIFLYHDWFWHSVLPKRISIFLWRAWANCLFVDEGVQNNAISLALSCDCYERKASETINHVLSSRDVASIVWSYASAMI